MIFLRYFGVVLLIAGVALVGWYLLFRDTRPSKEVPAYSSRTPKQIAREAEAIRQLDKLMTDRMLIGNLEWQQKTEEILKEWYGEK